MPKLADGVLRAASTVYGSAGAERNFSIRQFYCGTIDAMNLSPQHQVDEAYLATNKKFLLKRNDDVEQKEDDEEEEKEEEEEEGDDE